MKKIIYLIITTVISAFLGIFILPIEVETKRWVEIDSSEEKIWSEISQVEHWENWQIWDDKNGDNSTKWYSGKLALSDVDKESRIVHFTVDNKGGQGTLAIEKVPDGVWLGCTYSFQARYMPWDRLSDWLKRGELALDIDKALQKIKKNLETI